MNLHERRALVAAYAPGAIIMIPRDEMLVLIDDLISTRAKLWNVRFELCQEACDGEDEDRIWAKYNSDWIAAYVAEFVQCATARGWTEANAREWAEEIAQHALIDGGTRDPVKVARDDGPFADCEHAHAC